MALIEAEESEVLENRRLAATLRELMGNPKSRRKVLEAQKEAHPDAVIPELDAAKPVLEEVSKIREEMSKWMKAQEEGAAKKDEENRVNALKLQWNEGRNKAKAEGYTDDGLKALEDFMEKRGIADHELAIPAFERIHPPAKSEAPANKGFSIFNPSASAEDEGMKLLLSGQDEKFLSTSIPAILSDIRGSRGR